MYHIVKYSEPIMIFSFKNAIAPLATCASLGLGQILTNCTSDKRRQDTLLLVFNKMQIGHGCQQNVEYTDIIFFLPATSFDYNCGNRVQ